MSCTLLDPVYKLILNSWKNKHRSSFHKVYELVRKRALGKNKNQINTYRL